MMKLDAVIIDIDGTLTHSEDIVRLPHGAKFCDLPQDVKDSYYSKVHEHAVQPDCVEVVWKFLTATPKLIYLTGRDEIRGCVDVRFLTLQWLKKHGFPPATLVMRPYGEDGESHVVKRYLVEQMELKGNILAIDDEDKNLQMFHELGFVTMKSPYCWKRLSGII